MKLSKEYFENPFAHVCSEAGVFGDTGFPRKTIDALWNKYGNLLRYRQREKYMHLVDFYMLFKYAHLMPTRSTWGAMMTSQHRTTDFA